MQVTYESLKDWDGAKFAAAQAAVIRRCNLQRAAIYLVAFFAMVCGPLFSGAPFSLTKLGAVCALALLTGWTLNLLLGVMFGTAASSPYAPVLESLHKRARIAHLIKCFKPARDVRDHALKLGRTLYAIDLTEMERVAAIENSHRTFSAQPTEDCAYRYSGALSARFEELSSLSAGALASRVASAERFWRQWERAASVGASVVVVAVAWIGSYDVSAQDVRDWYPLTVFGGAALAIGGVLTALAGRQESRFTVLADYPALASDAKSRISQDRSAQELRDQAAAAGRPLYAFDLAEMERRAGIDEALRIMDGSI